MSKLVKYIAIITESRVISSVPTDPDVSVNKWAGGW